jgi:hypothetical protein
MKDLKNKILEIQSHWLKLVKNSDLAISSFKTIFNFLDFLCVDPTQFIFEFLQNAEDALMEINKKGYFKVKIYKDKIILSNNGKTFDEKDIESLCSFKSSKNFANGYKGFIGIGWKSVFKVSDCIEICSGKVSFKFSKEFWKSDEAKEILEKYNIKPEDVIWQLTPVICDTKCDETCFFIHLKNPSLYNEIAKAIDELDPSLFIFLDYVNEIVINDFVRNKNKRIECNVVEENLINDVKVKNVRVCVDEDDNVELHDFLVFKKDFEVPKDIDVKVLKNFANVALAFEIDSIKEELKPIGEKKFCGIYSFLPLVKWRTGLNFLIQGDFIVHPNRRYIDVKIKWNHWIMQCLSEVLKVAIDYVSKRFTKSYLSVFDYIPKNGKIWKKLIKPYIIKTINEKLRDPKVLCYKGHEIKLSQAVKICEDLEEIINELDEDYLKYIYNSEKHILHPKFKLREIDKKNVTTLTLIDLLDEKLINALAEKDLEKAIKFLNKLYEVAYRKNLEIPLNRRFVITSFGRIRLAKNVYIPKIHQKILEICKKFPEIDEYIKSLEFLNEKMIANEEILKWIGIKEIDLKELVEKIVLKQIIAKNNAPDKEKLLFATYLVKQANIDFCEPIWVLTKDGRIESSSNVWNPEIFNENVAKLLGIKLLDIDAYVKCDNDVEGWKRFFRKIVKGF